MSTADNLRRAKALIEDPKHWCQGASARDSEGNRVWEQSSEAVQWCAEGVLCHLDLARDFQSPEWDVLILASTEILGKITAVPYEVNDDIGHAAVMRMYDRAIELADERTA